MRQLSLARYLLLTNRLLANSGSNCENVHITATWFQPIAAVSNSSLFLIRALAVFAESSWKNKAGFVLVWSTVFLTFAFPFGSKVNSVPSCTVKDIGLLGSLGFLGIVVFDTLVVVTISFKLLHLNQEHRDSGATWIASLVRGKGLGHISKVLLYSGQLYYLYVIVISGSWLLWLKPNSFPSSTTVGLTAFAAVMFFPINSSFPPTVRAGFSSASWAIQNIMVCKVFRLLRLGAIQDDMTTRQLPSIRFATGDSTALADTETFALDEIGAQSTII